MSAVITILIVAIIIFLIELLIATGKIQRDDDDDCFK